MRESVKEALKQMDAAKLAVLAAREEVRRIRSRAEAYRAPSLSPDETSALYKAEAELRAVMP